MKALGLQREVVDPEARAHSVERLKKTGAALPTWSQLADPGNMPTSVQSALEDVDPDAPDPLNLWRVHWYNAGDRKTLADVPEHVVLPPSLTGVEAPIIVLLGNRFPMIEAHKVLAAYGCLVPRLVTGQFDATRHRAIWPSTGNYCRGGVAISKVLGCRGVAVLPEGMSAERFEWLSRWTQSPDDIIRTPGTESNVKEIYDACNRLDEDPANVIFNQFCEFGNHLIHYHVTGQAAEAAFARVKASHPELNLAAFVSATGSAGTIAAGDRLKDAHGTRIVAAEALECPTMLYNGFGEHNIQGIGDKHIPYIHNVKNTDLVSAISDESTDSLFVLFNSDQGREVLAERGIDEATAASMADFGPSGICNMLSAMKTARLLGLGKDDAIVTVATDGASLYRSEYDKIVTQRFGGSWTRDDAARVADRHLGVDTDHILELDERSRDRIFNLGYFTWVEQQGVTTPEFERRRSQEFWVGLRELIPVWDRMIDEFNRDTGAGNA